MLDFSVDQSFPSNFLIRRFNAKLAIVPPHRLVNRTGSTKSTIRVTNALLNRMRSDILESHTRIMIRWYAVCKYRLGRTFYEKVFSGCDVLAGFWNSCLFGFHNGYGWIYLAFWR